MRPRSIIVLGCSLSLAGLVAGAGAQPKSSAIAVGRTVLQVQAPLSLTASDGEGLELRALQARAVVQDPLAFTELHLTFHNPESRIREGRFRITLPSGAVISRFAMKVAGNWQEGEVVEKQAARRAYEDFLHRRQDPAMMESEAGNEFSARIFPIPANGEKELIISYSQELQDSATPYRLPLLGLPKLGTLDARVMVARSESTGTSQSASSLGGTMVRQDVVELQRTNFLPDQDLVVPLKTSTQATALRHDNLVVARVRPIAQEVGADPISNLVVLFDTSASRALGYAQSVRRLQDTLTATAKLRDFDVNVFAFDQSVASIYKGKGSAFGTSASGKLIERRAEGASNLGLALQTIRETFANNAEKKRLLLVTDGVATVGSTAGDELAEAIKALSTSGFDRVDVMAVGGIRDDQNLRFLTTAGLARAGVVLSPEASAQEASRRLSLSTSINLKVQIPGAAWVWPTQLDGIQPGDEVLVYADLPATKLIDIQIGGKPLGTKMLTIKAERPLLERAWIKARLSRLEQQKATVAAKDPDLQAALIKQMIELSTKFRVLCNYTALLVLETEADYERFHIDRRSLANIITVGSTGIEVVSRTGNQAISFPIATRQQPVGRRKPTDQAAARRKDFAADGAAPLQDDKRVAGGNVEQPKEEAPERERDSAEAPAVMRESVEASKSVSAPPSAAPPAPRALAGTGSAADSFAGSAALEVRRARPGRTQQLRARPQEEPSESFTGGPAPLQGKLAEITLMISRGQKNEALRAALNWRTREPGDVLAIVALGQAFAALGNKDEASRAFGSIIDLFPGRADLRRFAAGYLEKLATPNALALAVDCLTKAADDRPDHPSSHHLQAMALLQAKRPADAFAKIETALATHYPDGRFAGADQILREDLGLCAAAWIRAEPKRRSEILARLQQAAGTVEDAPSVRFVLTWETDANDVDFHIFDGRGGHAFYSQPTLPSGGKLYADVTTGYGPECFTIRGAAAKRAYPYKLSAHYYSKGPMGYGMGRLAVIEHDGNGGLNISSRPFVVMTDGAYLDLGQLRATDR